ncbi:MAG: exonuclease, partial [Pseudomonadota bacterium]
MAERLGLRARFALFFAALAIGGTGAFIGGLVFGASRGADGYIIAGLVGGLGLLALAAWIALLFDQNVARPILALASDLTTRARARVAGEIDEAPARYLGALAPAANTIRSALDEAREAQEAAIAERTARLNHEKALFEALLRDLAEGVVVATPEHRIMLYNRVAQGLLGDLGLDRDVTGFLRPEPLLAALSRLTARQARGETAAESFLVARADGTRFLLARVSPIGTADAPIGYVMIFHDATEDLTAHAERDHIFNTLLEGVRRPAAALGAVLDVLQSDAEMPALERATFNAAMQAELDRLTTCLGEMTERHEAATTRRWPMAEVSSAD